MDSLGLTSKSSNGRNMNDWCNAPCGPGAYLFTCSTNASQCASQLCVWRAMDCHDSTPQGSAYRCSSSSQRNHRLLRGLLTRMIAGQESSTACHSESRHTTALHASRSGVILTTWPAQHHLLFGSASCQRHMPDSRAIVRTYSRP